MLKRFLSLTVIVCFFLTTLGPLPKAHADTVLNLPVAGAMVNLSPAYMPVMIKGLKVHPDNPLLFDFILDTGKSGLKINSPEFKAESQKLIKYFLASLTIKEDDLWVNLSPYEKDRMVPQELGATELGRDMLAQDYILKQLTASLIYPEKQLGKKFWDSVYTKARQMYGVTDIPVNTFNKVWIVADKAKVLEHNNAAYVVGSHLKVMLEEDYLALSHHVIPAKAGIHNKNNINALGSQVIRAIILPELEKEVNQGQNFAPLRQMFYSMILASWYKLALKDALLNQVYSNKGKTSGVLSDDPAVKEKIYQQYLKAYKKGVFNYIKEDIANPGLPGKEQGILPRKYFSGGEKMRLRIGENLTIEHEQSRGDAPLKDGDLAMASVQIAGKNNAAVAESKELKKGGSTSLEVNIGQGIEEIDTKVFIKTATQMINQLELLITMSRGFGPKARIFSYSSLSAYFYINLNTAKWIMKFLTTAKYYEGAPFTVSVSRDSRGWYSGDVLVSEKNATKEQLKELEGKVKAALEKFREDLRKVRVSSENGDIPRALLEIVRTDAAMTGKVDKAMTVLGRGATSLSRIEDVIKITAQKYAFGPKEEATQAAEDIRLYLRGNASLRDTANRLVGIGVFNGYKEAANALIVSMVQSTDMLVNGEVGDIILDYLNKGDNPDESITDAFIKKLATWHQTIPGIVDVVARLYADEIFKFVNKLRSDYDGNLYITIKPYVAIMVLGEGSTSLSRIEKVIEIMKDKYGFELKEEATEDIRLYLRGNASLYDIADKLVNLGVFKEYEEAANALIVAMIQSTELPVAGGRVWDGNMILDYLKKKGYDYRQAKITMDPLENNLISYYLQLGVSSYFEAQDNARRVLAVVNQIKNNHKGNLHITITPDFAMTGKADVAMKVEPTVRINGADRPEFVKAILENLQEILPESPVNEFGLYLGQTHEILRGFNSDDYMTLVAGDHLDRFLKDLAKESNVPDEIEMDASGEYYVKAAPGKTLIEKERLESVRKALLENIQTRLGDENKTASNTNVANWDLNRDSLRRITTLLKKLDAKRGEDKKALDARWKVPNSSLIAKDINGGIDLNARNMGLDVAHDGKGIEMNFDPAMVAEFQKGNFTGVEGIILRIIPIQSPLPILGLETA